MNQRIKDLYILADRFALDKANNTSHEEFEYTYDDVMLGKFAELIVKECISQALSMRYAGNVEVAKRLEEHFGVK
jgi:hypothetical protein